MLFDKKIWKKWHRFFLANKLKASPNKKFIRILACSMIEVNLAPWLRHKRDEHV